jgi:hypothetical protein
VEGLRTRALSGENAGGSVCAADHVDGGAGKPDSAGVSETGRIPRACIVISGPGSGVVGRDRSPRGSVCFVDLTSRRYSGARGCAG